MMKKLGTAVVLAIVHFTVSKAVVAIAMRIDMFAADAGWATIALGRSLIALTRVLYFPIITLSLYSRQWFPGEWIYVPIAANSLLWGTVTAIFLRWWLKHRKSR